jgi:hypothetical protein
MATATLIKAGSITIEDSETSASFTIFAQQGTCFKGEWRDLSGADGLGEFLLESDGGGISPFQ